MEVANLAVADAEEGIVKVVNGVEVYRQLEDTLTEGSLKVDISLMGDSLGAIAHKEAVIRSLEEPAHEKDERSRVEASLREEGISSQEEVTSIHVEDDKID